MKDGVRWGKKNIVKEKKVRGRDIMRVREK